MHLICPLEKCMISLVQRVVCELMCGNVRVCLANAQYSSRKCVEIAILPADVNYTNLESKKIDSFFKYWL